MRYLQYICVLSHDVYLLRSVYLCSAYLYAGAGETLFRKCFQRANRVLVWPTRNQLAEFFTYVRDGVIEDINGAWEVCPGKEEKEDTSSAG